MTLAIDNQFMTKYTKSILLMTFSTFSTIFTGATTNDHDNDDDDNTNTKRRQKVFLNDLYVTVRSWGTAGVDSGVVSMLARGVVTDMSKVKVVEVTVNKISVCCCFGFCC